MKRKFASPRIKIGQKASDPGFRRGDGTGVLQRPACGRNKRQIADARTLSLRGRARA
jgi:hypothetical protein